MNRKRILLGILAFVFLIQAIYIIGLGDVAKKYYVSENVIEDENIVAMECGSLEQVFKTKKTRLDSIELLFVEKADDAEGYAEISIIKDGVPLWIGKISLADIEEYEWKKIYIGIPIEQNANYILKVDLQNVSGILKMALLDEKKSVDENLKLRINDEVFGGKSIAIKYGYLKLPTILERVVYFFQWMLIDIIVYLFILKRSEIENRIRNHVLNLLDRKKIDVLMMALEITACIFITYILRDEFYKSTIVVFFLISVIVVYRFCEKVEQVKKRFNNNSYKIGITILVLANVFGLVGNRTVVLPIGNEIGVQEILLLFVSIMWAIPIAYTEIFWLIRYSHMAICEEREKEGKITFFAVSMMFLLLPAIVGMYAFNPIIATKDTLKCVEGAHNLVGASDWFPPFYYIFLRLGYMIWDNVCMSAIQQIVFWGLVFEELFFSLRKHRVGDGIIYLFAFLIGVNVNNILYLNTVWKDIPYCCAIVWLTVILLRLYVDWNEYEHRWGIYVELVCALVCTYFLRKNGLVPYVMTIWAIIFVFRKKWKAYVTLMMSIIIIFIIQFPVYNYLQIENASSNSMYLGLGQDVLGTYYSGGELTEEAVRFVTQLTKNDNSEHRYSPTYYLYSENNQMQITITEFVKNVLTTAIRNPSKFATSVLYQ